MTVHYQHALTSAFHLQHSRLQNLYHLSHEQAAIPAVKKVLLDLIPQEFSLFSGHLTKNDQTSPLLDLIVYPKHEPIHEELGEWAVLDASKAICVVYQSEREASESLQGLLSENCLSLSIHKLLSNQADVFFNKIEGLFESCPSKQADRTLVLDKRVEKASQVASSVNGISIPYKEPLKKSTYTTENTTPEPQQSRHFDPGQSEGPDGHFPIHKSVLRGEVSAVSEYLQMGGDTELKNKNGDTLLHLAARNNQLEIAELLLISEAKVNSRNYVYAAPLHLAVRNGLEEMLDLLVSHGAELEARNNRGKTPLHIAAIHGKRACATLLLEKGADIHALMEKSMNPLHLAAWYGQSEIARRLIELGADLDATNEDGNTALHFAAFNGQVKVIKVLMVNGAHPGIQNKAGETYLQGVNEGYSGEMIKVLE